MPNRIISLLVAVLTLVSWLPSKAQAPEDSIRISVITCFPGSDIYELCGHSALRVRTATTDSVWNYGVFDFNAPHFIYRFVKGETDYQLRGYPFSYFMPEYINRGSKVVEQELNLTQDEARKLRKILQVEGYPQNCEYRYNYVKDNCATRIPVRIHDAIGYRIELNDTLHYGTFRNEMRAFHKNYPWYQFGIDLALGSGLDYKLLPEEEMFVPVEMMRRFESAKIADGRPLVSQTNELFTGTPMAVLPPTPWYATPLFVSWVLFGLLLVFCLLTIKYKRVYRGVWAVWYAITGLAGCLITFLVFFSLHDSTSPNLLIWWLNPVALLVPVLIWWRRFDVVTTAIMWFTAACVAVLLIAWPFQSQSANPAFFPLMGCSLMLAATWIIAPHSKEAKAKKGKGKPRKKSTRK